MTGLFSGIGWCEPCPQMFARRFFEFLGGLVPRRSSHPTNLLESISLPIYTIWPGIWPGAIWIPEWWGIFYQNRKWFYRMTLFFLWLDHQQNAIKTLTWVFRQRINIRTLTCQYKRAHPGALPFFCRLSSWRSSLCISCLFPEYSCLNTNVCVCA